MHVIRSVSSTISALKEKIDPKSGFLMQLIVCAGKQIRIGTIAFWKYTNRI